VAQYSIKELEHLSGIKAHTIRIWEQRYSILKPQRTETNIRYYDDADLKTILNISLLNEHGYKISRIAGMSRDQVAEEVMKVAGTTASNPQQMNALLVAMIEMDEERFDKVLTTVILQKGLEQAMLEILCPLLVKTGLLWQVGSITPAQEHFVSSIIRQKLYVAIDGQLPADKKNASRFLLYLPEGELHEIGLLFSNFLLRARGKHVMYLGQNMPFEDLQTCVSYYKPHYICTAFTYMPERDQVQQYINRLAALAPEVIVYIGGHLVQFQEIQFPPNIIRLPSLPDFIQHIDHHKGR
jgi:MerR family transcriptional regulator, light-induced transcriptional regulator